MDSGEPERGHSENILGDLNLPDVLFGSNVGGAPAGKTVDAAGNTQNVGPTPTDGTTRADVPWARLDGTVDTNGINLAPGYAFDVAGGGFVGMSFDVQTYPGLAEWINHDFEGLRDKLYEIHPDWKAQGLLDGGVSDLNKIEDGLAARFLHVDQPDDFTHITKKELLAMPFRFNVVGAATALTRDEFGAEQTTHAKQLRTAILADSTAPTSLAVLAADVQPWVNCWLGAPEVAGLLRPLDQWQPLRTHPDVPTRTALRTSAALRAPGGDRHRPPATLHGC